MRRLVANTAENDLLRNAGERRGINAFDKKIGGRTDRFMVRIRKFA